jgi:hypothetical protein
LLTEWSTLTDKAWNDLSKFDCEIKREMDGELSIENLDNLIIKMDKGYTNCINLIKKSVKVFDNVDLLYKDYYNKIYKGRC